MAWLCVLGCGPGEPPRYPVSGSAEFQGKPLTMGTVALHHEDGLSPMVKGEIQSDGHFTLGTHEPGDGAVAGNYTVTVTSMTPGQGTEGDPDYRPAVPLIPIRYMRLLESPLKVKVEEKENVLQLSLTR
jgi:hypothetical protein